MLDLVISLSRAAGLRHRLNFCTRHPQHCYVGLGLPHTISQPAVIVMADGEPATPCCSHQFPIYRSGPTTKLSSESYTIDIRSYLNAMPPARRSQRILQRSNADSLVERSKRINIHDVLHEDFLTFAQSVPPHLADKYLTILEEIFKHCEPKRTKSMGDIGVSRLIVFWASGKVVLTWKQVISVLKIQKNQSLQKKFVQLAFLRRYPDYYENDKIDHQARVAIIDDTLDHGLARLQSATEPNILPLDVIRKGFLSDYIGRDEIVTPILSTLNEHATSWTPEEYHAPCTSIIGPTMAGKTRLLMELADEICVVYICLRPPTSIGEPKRSQLATEMLKPPPCTDLETYYVDLITAILSVTIKFFQSASKTKDRKELLRAWYQHHNSPKTKFYSNVQSELRRLTSKNDTLRQLDLAAERLGKTHVLESSPLKVLLAIDEANSLFDERGTQTDSHGKQSQELPLSHFFRRALRHVPSMSGIFAILVDSDSRVANFNPSARIEVLPTNRPIGVRAQPSKMYPDIYELRTIDRMAPANPPRRWAQLFSPERLCKYGVPFFSLQLTLAVEDGRALDPTKAVHVVAGVALNKLLCAPMAGPRELTESRALALLGPTIGVPLHGQARLNAQLMASHAAHCGYIDAERHCHYSFYPSQPIYALAANHYLLENEEVLIMCINFLTGVLSEDHMSAGDVGEIASRIILLCAMNKTAADIKTAKQSSANPRSVGRISIPDPVPVIKFLETLTGLSAHELPLGSIDADHKHKLLEQGMMFWNHFMHCLERPTTESLLECLQRGLALHSQPSQEVFDQVLTIYLKEQSEDKLDEANVTFCGIRARNRKHDFELNTSQQIMNPETAKIDMKEKSNPYLSLYFTFQDTPLIEENPIRRDDYELPSHGPPDGRQASLVFYGLDSFHFLSPGLKNALKELINIRPDPVSRSRKRKAGEEYATDFLLRADARRLI
ncbi:uncharacterized protein PGTG_10484 [Puccinia graminis f. sp. tritici CRL 75-36-700-3]|uniref:Uncharacterized protein n=1 Tax=Puccinia graminis f. sp. tritici (strain CRL 75-36-700-3 / race SCCL) TaxID=418459 RepID=E3KII1_PUCGT|nr:uncharacterized protein PGTG_10484 [Puccinia graminis f. sp. tritici CRL 75-36-700-3]EFP84106.2 hypothetical protein PGTG_10484 [Puccinia graminis f. sp. tritici CRL 75-36-700-3]